jgi:outer membrane protein OmpA-like peptidoglycan-associated protein
MTSLILALSLASLAPAQTMPDRAATQLTIAKRATLAIRYPESEGTSVDMVGTSLYPKARGKAEVKRKDGRTRIQLKITNLEHPQSLGAYYTTYLLWAVAPEGQADNLAELPMTRAGESEIEVTTNYQTFGLIVTAEPHAMVKLPSPVIVAENILRRETKGGIESSQIEYRGDPGTLYVVSSPDTAALTADYSTPLTILGARRAVEIARRAGAGRFAEPELRSAEIKLEALEQTWPRERREEKKLSGLAQDVMRLGEQARALAVERSEQARLEAERRAASSIIAQARSEAAQAQSQATQAQMEAARAKEQAASYREAMLRSERELEMARQRASQAQTEAERAKANEEVARIEAERSRLESEQAKRERDEMRQRLFVSISEILETRREARGLIVNLSDVLFDFNKATLKPGAKEKLSKLTGIMLAYPGPYRIEIEGHTDAIGSEEYNLKLSEERANSVRSYLLQAGIAQNRIIATRGLGKSKPVATNDTPEGRQVNRRVEIIIADTDTTAADIR